MKLCAVALLLFLSVQPARTQNRYDIVINEIMADPTPSIGLPGNEWVELKNSSSLSINLRNWRIGDLAGQSGPMPDFILKPDSLVIICTGSALTAMSAFGTAISVGSFPSLDNDGDQLFLKAADATIIHAVAYSLSWYQNELKKEGGWTLEMIDPQNPCSGMSNWKASMDSKGGTPGKANSVQAVNIDVTGPQLHNVYAIDSVTIRVVYDEPVDSSSGALAINYSIDHAIRIISAKTISPLFNQAEVKIDPPLQRNIIYTITASNVLDCHSNPIGSINTARVGLPADPKPGELAINEILFNPVSNGFDYVELYNNGSTPFDASRVYIANRNSSGVISSIKPISVSPVYIFPGDYFVITENADRLSLNYLVRYPEHVLEIASLPSYPNDEGDVILLNSNGEIADEVAYKDDWHFPLLTNPEGVSLERIDPGKLSQDAANWHSAASTAGYGTPTYQNSQYRNPQGIAATIKVVPAVFSPDNDGADDFASIQYKIDEPGYVANISIFDAAGRIVKRLAATSLLSTTGYWNWDGLNDKGQQLPIGIYIIYTEIFNLQGKKQQFKNTVVLARPLKP